jgi:hypothetical protein
MSRLRGITFDHWDGGAGHITTGLQAGLAHPVGGAAIVAAGTGSDQLLYVVPGIHWGLGLLVPMDSKSLLRADPTRHLYVYEGRRETFWSVGLGFAALRRAKGQPAASRALPD